MLLSAFAHFTYQWKREGRFYEGFANFLSSLPTGHGEGDFTKITENFSSHFAIEELRTVLTKISEIFFSTTHRTWGGRFYEGYRKFLSALLTGHQIAVLAKFSKIFLLTTHWRSDSGLAENLGKFLSSLPTGHEIAVWSPIFEIFSSQVDHGKSKC